MPEYHRAAALGDAPPGEIVGVRVAGKAIAIANVEGALYAFDAECTHASAWLYEGFLEGHNVICPLHFAEFDVRTGEVREMPAMEPLRTYPVRVTGGAIEVAV